MKSIMNKIMPKAPKGKGKAVNFPTPKKEKKVLKDNKNK